MKIISFATGKGGAGKSTSCLVTAQVLAHQKKKVCVLDADPNAQIVSWQEDNDTNISVVGDINERTIIKTISEQKEFDYVLIDLEGKASLLTSRAILKSDFVVVPMQASLPDAVQADRIINLIKDDEQILEKEIKHAVLFNRTSPLIKTKIEKQIFNDIKEADYPLFDSQLNERIAYKNIFFDKSDLYNLSGKNVSGLDKAISNAEQFVEELERKI